MLAGEKGLINSLSFDPDNMAWRVEKEAVTNENPVVDSVFIDPERSADELPGNSKYHKRRKLFF